MSQPKIMVFHLKELIYTMIFLLLGILLILLLLVMFLPKAKSSGGEETTTENSASNDSVQLPASEDASYYAGIYTSSYILNNQTMEIEVILDENHINSIRFVNIDDTVETVSPLLLPSMEDLAVQIVTNQSFENITVPEGSEYTYQVLIEGIKATIAKGTMSESS